MPKNIATIEQHYEACGFAYTERTRMMYAPKFTVTRRLEDKLSTDIVLCPANGHPLPTETDIEACKNALVAMFPTRNLFAETPDVWVKLYSAPY
jgi:hypothetical protein